MVSAEPFRFKDSRTVETLLTDTTLACFSWETRGDAGFALIVPTASFSSSGGGRGCPLVFDAGDEGLENGSGTPDTDRAVDLRVAVDLVDIVERTEAVETVRFAIGLTLGESVGFPLIDGIVLEATDGGRLGKRGVLAPVVCTLEVEIAEEADVFRVRPTLLGVSSERAVSKAVEFSLAVVVEETLEEPDTALGVEGPAAPLRIVDVVERVDLMDAATDFGRGTRSGVVVE